MHTLVTKTFNTYLIILITVILTTGCTTTQPNKNSRLAQQKLELESAGFKIDYIRK